MENKIDKETRKELRKQKKEDLRNYMPRRARNPEKDFDHKKYTRRALKSYRHRFWKNLFIWFNGIIGFILMTIGAIAIVLTSIPMKSLLGGSSEKAGVIAEMNLLEAIINVNNYTFESVPFAKDLIKEINDTEIMDGKKLSDFVLIKTDELDDVGLTAFFGEIDKHIEVVATIDGVIGIEALGDLGKLAIFSEWEAVDGTIDLSDPEFNASLYYYKDAQDKYQRAYGDDKTLKAPDGATIYYGALAYVPIVDAVQIIDESLGREKLTDLITNLGGAELTEESMLTKFLGDLTVSEVGEITDVELDKILPEEDNAKLYDILRSAAGLEENEAVTLNSLSGLNTDNINLESVLDTTENTELFKILRSGLNKGTEDKILIGDLKDLNIDNVNLADVLDENDNQKLFDILRQAGEIEEDEELLIGTLSGLDFNKINLNVVLSETENEQLFDILRSATGVSDTDPVTIGALSNLDTNNLDLCKVLDEQANEELYKILRSATGITTGPITIEALGSLDTNKIELEQFLKESENSELYKILRSATGVSSGALTIENLSTINTDNIDLEQFLPEEDNEDLYKVLRSATGINEGIISIGNLTGISFDNVNLNTIIDETANAKLFDLLRSSKGLDSDEPVTISVLSDFNIDMVKINKVLDLPEESTLRKVMEDALDDYNKITVGQLAELGFDKVSLSTIMPSLNKELKVLLEDIYGLTYSEITIEKLNGTSHMTDIKLCHILKDDNDTGNIFIDAIREDEDVSFKNIGEKIDEISLHKVYGQNAFTSDLAKTNNPLAKYTKTEENDETTYTLDANGDYYISKDAGVWLLMCYDSLEVKTNGVIGKYVQSKTTIKDLETGANLTDKFKSATVRQLMDIGILSDSIDEELWDKTLENALTPEEALS